MINSLKNNRIGIILMLLSSFFVCIGQLFWKLSNNGSILFLIIGFGFYGIGALIMIKAYSFGKLSILQPILSANYIFTILLGNLILNETISGVKFIGILAIVFGVILIGGSDDG